MATSAVRAAWQVLADDKMALDRPHAGAKMLWELLARQKSTPTQNTGTDTTQHVLFFDGGSRGNPGSGGAGAVIVAVNDDGTSANIVWCAALSLKHPSTTNNFAEYRGVVAGLRAAHQHSWSHLEVVGDSFLILRQLRDYCPPRNSRLLKCYTQARRLADQLDVQQWTHHLRAYNKMADAAANVAMDHQISIAQVQPLTRPELAHLPTLLSGDIAHWRDRRFRRQLEDS